MEKSERKECQVRMKKTEPLAVGSKVYMSANVTDLSEEDIEKARLEFGEMGGKQRRYIQDIRNKLSEEGNYRTDDDFLLRFLRVRKYDCGKAYENVKNFYKMRNKHPDLFGIPAEIKSYKNFKFVTTLPYADLEGRPMFWVDLEYWDPQVMSFEEYIQPLFALCDVVIANPMFQVNGCVGIWDFRTVGFGHVKELVRKNRYSAITSLLQFTYPWRLKKILIVGTGPFTRFIYNLFRPLLSRKMVERVFLLGSDPSEVHQHVDPAILPKKLGGILEDDFCRRPELILDNIPYLEYDRSFTGLN